MMCSGSRKLRWALSSGHPRMALARGLGLLRSRLRLGLTSPPVSSATRPSRKANSCGNSSPRLVTAGPLRTSWACRNNSSTSPAALPSLSSDRNSSPCAWRPSPWCRPAPRDPASPVPPAGTTPIPAGTGPTALPDCPCGSPSAEIRRVVRRQQKAMSRWAILGRTPPRRVTAAPIRGLRWTASALPLVPGGDLKQLHWSSPDGLRQPLRNNCWDHRDGRSCSSPTPRYSRLLYPRPLAYRISRRASAYRWRPARHTPHS